jgi:ferredoxin-type protein NapF
MACLKECPKECIFFNVTKAEKLTVSGRRQFLISAGAILAGMAAGLAFAKSGISLVRRKLQILPPGAGNARRFSRKCTACMLCVANCPKDIIVPSRNGTAIIELDLSQGSCDYNCNRCGNICPTGAISFLALPLKRRVKIAEAKFDPRNCIAFQDDEKCGKCGKACPTGAITLRKNTTPRPIKKHLCIGCGACQAVCPAPEKAMTVSPIEKQIILQSQGED